MLELISFVGVDQFTDRNKLIAYNEVWEFELKQVEAFKALYATKEHKFIEYGFLYSESRMGKDARYPTLEYIKNSLDLLALHGVPTSVHLCGEEAINKYLSLDPEIIDMCQNSRVQLNFNIKKYDEDCLVDKLLYTIDFHNKPLIVQSNKSKASFISKLLKQISLHRSEFPNIDILYDGSGGFGRELEVADKPFKGFFTGYAGGIKPTNVAKILEKIETSIDPDTEESFYIDMESGIREVNKFSLSLCDGVVDEVNYYYST